MAVGVDVADMAVGVDVTEIGVVEVGFGKTIVAEGVKVV